MSRFILTGCQLFELNRTKEESDVLTYDPDTQSIIKLNNGMILYLREVNKYLALVCLIREDKFDKHGTLFHLKNQKFQGRLYDPDCEIVILILVMCDFDFILYDARTD
jgi:hypothetical protein